MKKICLLSIICLTTSVAFADTGVSGIGDAADGVVTYMPYVRAMCYVIAAVIAVVGAFAVYYSMHTNPQNTARRIFMTAGGALTFVSLSLALPQFWVSTVAFQVVAVPLPRERRNSRPTVQAFWYQTKEASASPAYRFPYPNSMTVHG